MPVIPAQLSPSVQPEGAPGAFRREQATPGDFGAGRAAGLGKVGQAVEQAGDVGANIAINFQKQQNATDVDAAYTAFESKKRASLFGDGENPGFYGLKGKAAYEAMQPTAKSLEELRNETRGALGNPEQQRMFDVMSRQSNRRDLDSMSRHAAAENQVYRVQVTEAAIHNGQTEAADYWNDPYRFGLAVGNIKLQAENRARLTGRTDQEEIKADVDHYVGQAWAARIKATMQRDPQAAEEMYRTNQGQIGDVAARVQLEHELKQAVMPVQAKTDAQRILAGGTLNPDKASPELIRVAAEADKETAAVAGVPTNKRDTRAQLANWVSTAEQAAERRYPNNPVYRDMVVSQIKGYVNTVTAAQEGIAREAHSYLLNAVNGVTPNGKGHPIIDFGQLMADPAARQKWTMLDPDGQRGVVAAIDQQANKALLKPALVNARIEQRIFNRMNLPADDENLISKPEQLTPFIAQGLTLDGHTRLLNKMDAMRTPEGKGFALRVDKVNRAAAHLMSSGIVGQMLKGTQPEKLAQAQLDFSLALDQKIEDYRKAGKEPNDLLTPGKPDYVGTYENIMTFVPGAKPVMSEDAKAKLPKVASDADYGKLDPGAQYVAPDGSVRTKGGAAAKPAPAAAPFTRTPGNIEKEARKLTDEDVHDAIFSAAERGVGKLREGMQAPSKEELDAIAEAVRRGFGRK